MGKPLQYVTCSRRGSTHYPCGRADGGCTSWRAVTLFTDSLLTPQDPPPLFSPPLQLYPHPNRLLRSLLGARQCKFPFLAVAGPDGTAALYPTD